MLNLIKNEYIKMMRVFVIVMVILLGVATIGTQGFFKLIFKFSDSLMGEFSYTVEDMIEDSKSGKSSDDPAQNEELAVGLALQDMGVENMDDWRCQLVYTILEGCTIIDENGISVFDYEKFQKEVGEIKGKNYDQILPVLEKNYVGMKFDKIEDAVENPYTYLMKLGVKEADDWRVSKTEELMSAQAELNMAAEGTQTYIKAQERVNILRYALDNNVDTYITKDTLSNGMMGFESFSDGELAWYTILSSSSTLSFLSIIMLVIAGSMVAKEFSTGTVKFLLMNPVSRGKIIISKYITVVSFSLILTVGIYVVSLIGALLFNGAGTLGADYVYCVDGVVKTYPAIFYHGLLILLGYAEVLVYATMAFAISSLIKSSALAVGAGIGCMAFGSGITTVLFALNQDWGRYLIFSNTDLMSTYSGIVLFPNMTMGFSVAVIAVHLIVFILAAYDGFVRREV